MFIRSIFIYSFKFSKPSIRILKPAITILNYFHDNLWCKPLEKHFLGLFSPNLILDAGIFFLFFCHDGGTTMTGFIFCFSFGMEHDGLGNKCKYAINDDRFIMSPTQSLTNHPYMWSSCSREYIRKFLL